MTRNLQTSDVVEQNEPLTVSRRGFLILAVLLSSLGLVSTAPNGLFAQQPGSMTNLLSGHVTGKGSRSIEIDRREYFFSKDVVIKDDEGRPRELKDFDQGHEVRFHLKQDRIDQLILVLPK